MTRIESFSSSHVIPGYGCQISGFEHGDHFFYPAGRSDKACRPPISAPEIGCPVFYCPEYVQVSILQFSDPAEAPHFIRDIDHDFRTVQDPYAGEVAENSFIADQYREFMPSGFEDGNAWSGRVIACVEGIQQFFYSGKDVLEKETILRTVQDGSCCTVLLLRHSC